MGGEVVSGDRRRAEITSARANFDKKGLPSPLLLNFYLSVTGTQSSGLVIVLDKAKPSAIAK